MTRIHPDTLRMLIHNGNIIPYFQPIINVRTGTCCGAEVLTRLRHPPDGIITPDQFISHDTPETTLSMLTQALMAAVTRELETFCFPPRFMLTFNIVPDTLSASWLLPACQKLSAHNVSVTLELTEQRPLTGDLNRLKESLSRLQAAGVRLAIDDFGTGYAGLSMLLHSGGDYIKIPREFITASPDNPRAGCVTGNILHLADVMRMDVIAEGVESQQCAEQLFAMGIFLFQGALFSMPLPFGDFIIYMRDFSERYSGDGGGRGSGSALSPELLLYCARLHGLSPRETEMIISIVQGERFNLMKPSGEPRSAKTLSTQKRNAYRKIGVKNDVGLLHYLYWLNDCSRQEGGWRDA
ncbi:TPA: EAL domain-containing protein [Citrobacter werkmanii]|nr:EAL domain-containing protein [Citrobacter werkmanii]